MSSPALRRMTVPRIAAYVANNQSGFTGELQAFVRIASISADPARTDDVKRCSRWLAAHLRRIGLQRVRTVPTKRHPIVYAEWTGAPGKPTVLIDRKHPAMQAAATAYRRVFGRVPRWVRSGGSIPAVSEFKRVLAVPTVLMGFASPGDSLHGPNETFRLKNFQRGILCSVAFLESLGRTFRNGRVIERAGQVALNGY